MFDAQRFISGDSRYVRDVIREHSPTVLMVCQSYARDYDHVQDLYQETWRTVCAKVSSFHGSGPFQAWLHRVATNVCVSDFRSQKSATAALDRFRAEASGPGAEWVRIDPLAGTERRELHRAIQRALPLLTDGEREAVTLRYLEGLGADDVAEQMGISPVTVRSHLRHARKRLRRIMEDPGHELSAYRTGY